MNGNALLSFGVAGLVLSGKKKVFLEKHNIEGSEKK